MHCWIIFLFASAVFAQKPSGEISGVITAPDGNPVSYSSIQLLHLETGQAFKGVGLRGKYAISNLPAGTYDLLIPDTGFTYTKFERKGIVLAAGEALRLDLKIEFSGSLGTIGDDDATILRANRPPAPAGPAPRMPDGTPDLSGVWNGDNDASPEIPSAMPWAEAIAQQRIATNFREHPSAQCLPADILLIAPNPFKIVQTRKQVVFVGEYNNGPLREVWLYGRPHPKELNPSWMGHSIGRWQGDTLIVDTCRVQR